MVPCPAKSMIITIGFCFLNSKTLQNCSQTKLSAVVKKLLQCHSSHLIVEYCCFSSQASGHLRRDSDMTILHVVTQPHETGIITISQYKEFKKEKGDSKSPTAMIVSNTYCGVFSLSSFENQTHFFCRDLLFLHGLVIFYFVLI